jgi:hypothetical protein
MIEGEWTMENGKKAMLKLDRHKKGDELKESKEQSDKVKKATPTWSRRQTENLREWLGGLQAWRKCESNAN